MILCLQSPNLSNLKFQNTYKLNNIKRIRKKKKKQTVRLRKVGLEVRSFGGLRDDRLKNRVVIGLKQGGFAMEWSVRLVIGRRIVRFGGDDGDDVVGDVRDSGGGRTRVKKVGGEELVLKTGHGRETRIR